MNPLLLASLVSIFVAPQPKPSVRRRRRNVFAWSADHLEPRLVLSSIVQILDNGAVVTYDETRISRIHYRGVDILTGGGIYLIGSASPNGADIPETNFGSIGSRKGRMVAPNGDTNGPNFTLRFTKKGPNVIKFDATIGPVNQDFPQIGMSFDFNRNAITTFTFGGTRLKYTGTGEDGWHDGAPAQNGGTRWRFDAIPQHQAIKNSSGRLLGRVGSAFTRDTDDMSSVKLFGRDVLLRIDLDRSSNAKTMGFSNHFAANAFGYGFGPLAKGESGHLSGRITIEPR